MSFCDLKKLDEDQNFFDLIEIFIKELTMKKIAVVILNWNGAKLLEQFLPSVIAFSNEATIYVADNASTDTSIEVIQNQFPTVKIIQNTGNFGFAKGYNEALKFVEEEYYALVNSDIEVTENWLAPILNIFETQPETAIIQPKLLDFKKKTHFEYAGGAGGFVRGLKYAMNKYPEAYYWLMDDDGYPEKNCLELLVEGLKKYSVESISPIQINIFDQSKLSFPIPLFGLSGIVNVSDLPKKEFLPQAANLFNGLLISKKVIDEIGLPREELFIRGDEVDFTKRMHANLIRFGMLITAIFYHPSDMNERIPLFGNRIITRDAHSDFKNYYLFRNRALSFKEDNREYLIYIDFIRYMIYFLVKKKMNIKGLRLWCIATIDGMKGKLGRHPKY